MYSSGGPPPPLPPHLNTGSYQLGGGALYQPKPGLGERVADVSKETYTWLRDYVTAIKNGRLHPFTAVERKAREATRKDPWGPTGQQLAELADLTHHPEHAHVIFAVLEYRWTRGPEKWRNVYKALLALEYLLVRGSEHAVQLGRGREVQQLLAGLAHFEAVGLGPGGSDAGVNVRLRSAAVLELLHDPQLLQQRRAAAAARFGAGVGGVPTTTASSSSSSSSYGGYSRQQMLSLQQQQQFAGAGSSGGGGYNDGGYNGGYNAVLNGYRGPSPYLTNAPPPSASASASAAAGAGVTNSSGVSASTPQQQQQRQRQQQAASASAAAAAGGGGGGGGGFGEAKGVSFEENKLRISELRQLLQREENRRCADCQDASPGGRPTWASVNLGVFICMRCAGTHRGLGAHISKVRSCTLDTWLPEQVVFMSQTGNAAANAHFEALLPQQQQQQQQSGAVAFRRPSRDSPEMAAFIRQKYADQKWVRRGSQWPPAVAPTAPQPTAAAAAAGLAQGPSAPQQQWQSQQQQQQQRLRVQLGATAAAAPAAVSAPPPAAPAATAAAGAAARTPAAAAAAPPAAAAPVADLLCLGDDGPGISHPRQGMTNSSGSAGGSFWDLMDAPMDVPDPQLSVIDWLDQRIQSGADAAAQAAADVARQHRQHLWQQQHLMQQQQGVQQQQQPQQRVVFDPFVAAGQQQQQQAVVQQSALTAAAAAPQQPAPAAAAAAGGQVAGRVGAAMHSLAAGLGSAMAHVTSVTLHRGASNVIQTYEFSLSDSDDDEEDEEAAAGVLGSSSNSAAAAAAAAAPVSRAGVSGSNGLAPAAAKAAAAGSAQSSRPRQQQGAGISGSGGSSSSSRPLLIPATPGYQTSGSSSGAAAGCTGRPAAAAAGYTGRPAAAAAGYTGRSTAAAAAGFTGRTGAAAAAGATGRSAAGAGFTGQRQQPGFYAGPVYRAPVVAAGFGGGWGGYYGMVVQPSVTGHGHHHSFSSGVTGGRAQNGVALQGTTAAAAAAGQQAAKGLAAPAAAAAAVGGAGWSAQQRL